MVYKFSRANFRQEILRQLMQHTSVYLTNTLNGSALTSTLNRYAAQMSYTQTIVCLLATLSLSAVRRIYLQLCC